MKRKPSLSLAAVGLLVFLTVPVCINAASQKDTTRAREDYRRARQFMESAEYDSAITAFHKAADLYRDAHHWEQYIRCLRMTGTAHRRQSEYDAASDTHREALKLAGKHLTPKHPLIGDILSGLGIIRAIKGDNAGALEYFTRALEIQKAALGESHLKTALRYQNIGILYRRTGEYSRALEYQLKSLDIKRRVLGDSDLELAYSYNNIGLVYWNMEEYKRSLTYHEKSLAMKQRLLPGVHPDIRESLYNMGLVYENMESFSQALDHYHRALRIDRKLYEGDHGDMAEAMEHIGLVHAKTGAYEKSETWYRKALEMYNRMLGESNHQSADVLCRLGDLYLKQDIFNLALDQYQEALTMLSGSFGDPHIFVNPRPEELPLDIAVLETLTAKSRALFQRFTSPSPGNKRDLETAYATAQLAYALADSIRYSRSSRDAKLWLRRQMKSFYEDGISMALHLDELTGDRSYSKEAFRISERAHAAVLNEAVTEAEARQFARIPDSLLTLERQLATDRTFYSLQIQRAQQDPSTDGGKLRRWRNRHFELNRQYEQLREYIETNYPGYASLQYDITYPEPGKLQSRLPDHTALVEYFLGDSALFIFRMDQDTYHVREIRAADSVTAEVRHLRNALENLQFREYIASASYLYQQLIKPVYSGGNPVRNLIIIPDGILHHLPFECLLRENPAVSGTNVDFASLPYLIHETRISYHFSGALWRNENPRIRSDHPEELFGMAPVEFQDPPEQSAEEREDITVRSGDQDHLIADNPPLPETEQELRRISRLFNEGQGTANVHLFGNATESTLKSADLEKYEFIHLATHGILNEDDPTLSGLLFSDVADESENGILYAGETYNLNLNADLVTLSACRSGLGGIARGEGIIGLTRGFFYSGASRVMVSLWQVNDKSTAELMIRFYEKLLENNDPAMALRSAKLKLINNGTFAYPLEWGSFVLIGG